MTQEGMDERTFYSIRMHASSAQGHLCGSERMVSENLLRVVSSAMVDRALNREEQGVVSMSIRVEAVDPAAIRRIALLPIQTLKTENKEQAEDEALLLLTSSGVSRYAARRALKAISSGPSPQGGNMRGSMIIHAQRGDRLEPDPERGVRVSHMDLTNEVKENLWRLLDKLGIRHPRVLEAMVLASKVSAIPGIIGEVCISDDPDYTTGYVATPGFGYVRIPNMKEKGDKLGGRAMFVENKDSLHTIIEELERTPYLIDEIHDI